MDNNALYEIRRISSRFKDFEISLKRRAGSCQICFNQTDLILERDPIRLNQLTRELPF